MKKILSLLSVLTIMGAALPNVIAASNYERHKRQAPPSLKNIFLPKLIKNTKLGNILTNSEENILHQVVRLNRNININDIAIARLIDNQAQIVLRENLENNIFYENNFIWVTFEADPDIEIQVGNSVFYNYLPKKDNSKNKFFILDALDIKNSINVGVIPDNNETTIMDYVRRSLPIFQDTVEAWNTIILRNITVSSAQLSIIVDKWHTEEFLITFTPERINLNSIITNSNLGEINNFDVLGKIYKLYPQLRNTLIFVSFQSTDIAKIYVSEDDPLYFGSVLVYFQNNVSNCNKINKKKDNNSKDDDDFSDNFKSNKQEEIATATKIRFNPDLPPRVSVGEQPGTSQRPKEECSEISAKKLSSSLITENINLNWEITGPITNDEKLEQKTINLIKWSDYANNLEEFKVKYKHIRFNDFSAQAGGQGTTVFNKTNIEFNTEQIGGTQINKEIIRYDFWQYIPFFIPFINYVKQTGLLYIKNLFFEGEYLKAKINSYTYSWWAVYHVWTKLNIKTIEFY